MRKISTSPQARARVAKDEHADARRRPPAASLHSNLPLGFYCRGPREGL
jgi:hypothetical protein